MPAISTGLALGLGLTAAAGGIGSAAIGASAAGNAANAQVNAANYAANLQKQEADQNLAFQKEMWQTQQQNIAPWLQVGGQSLGTLAQLLGLPGYTPQPSIMPSGQARMNMGLQPLPGQVSGTNVVNGQPLYPQGGVGGIASPGSPMGALPGGGVGAPGSVAPGGPMMAKLGVNGEPQARIGSVGANMPVGQSGQVANSLPQNLVPLSPWTEQFHAPTNVTEQNDPGYQFRLNQGLQALDRGAAANGTLLSGAGIKPYERYAQDYASNEYGNVYNRALGEYQQRYNIFNQNQANEWNRFASLAGLGQTSAAQLNSAGGQMAGNVSNIYTNLGNQLGNNANLAGAARASGYVGGGNAWSGALGGGLGNLQQLILMSQMGSNPYGPAFNPNSAGLQQS